MDYVYCTSSAEFSKQILVKVTLLASMAIDNGAKLGVAGVACATPLFLPRPEIMYKHASHFCPA